MAQRASLWSRETPSEITSECVRRRPAVGRRGVQRPLSQVRAALPGCCLPFQMNTICSSITPKKPVLVFLYFRVINVSDAGSIQWSQDTPPLQQIACLHFKIVHAPLDTVQSIVPSIHSPRPQKETTCTTGPRRTRDYIQDRRVLSLPSCLHPNPILSLSLFTSLITVSFGRVFSFLCFPSPALLFCQVLVPLPPRNLRPGHHSRRR